MKCWAAAQLVKAILVILAIIWGVAMFVNGLMIVSSPYFGTSVSPTNTLEIPMVNIRKNGRCILANWDPSQSAPRLWR
jgi:hypothetical protein